MRKIMAVAVAAVVCGGSLTFSGVAEAAGRSPAQCVKVRKFYDKGHQRYVRLTNLCTKRAACYVIVVPRQRDPRGRLAKGVTKNVRYGTTSAPRALYVKNTHC